MIMGEQPGRSLSLTFPDLPLDGDFEDLLELAMAGEPEVSPRNDEYAANSTHNAVHMEIQDNAKVPSFNLTIDRSNSVPRHRLSQQPYSPTTRQEIEEMMRLSEKDFSLSEVFLKSTNRSNQNVNYGSSAGAMLGSIGDKMGENNKQVRQEVQSEERNSSSTRPEIVPNPLNAGADRSAPLANQSGRQPYYNRQYQLPIPRSTPPPASAPTTPKALTMADAIATAAAIVSQAPSDAKPNAAHRAIPSSTPQTSKQPQPTAMPITSTTIITGRGQPGIAAPPSVAPQSYHQYPPPRSAVARTSMPYSRLNAATTANITPQIASATKQRSQFGFGGNHQVPCVPLPPKRATANGHTKKKKQCSKTAPASSPVLMASSLNPAAGNAGPAYERKKQRAKDARVKLNDSIERLSIAMSMAGTQSHQRSLQSASSLMSAHCKKSMETCAQTAESAKKWDRPGFVGTAATLIQTLNAQCESLMRELIKHQAEAAAIAARNGVNLPNGSGKRAPNGQIIGEEFGQEGAMGSNSKRLKIIDTSEVANELRRLVFHCEDNAKVLANIASFLDPQSLLRCQRLTRMMGSVFGNDSLWLDRCIQRFGLFHVRQWKEKLEDEENEDGQVGHPSSIVLYRQMDAENIKPIHSTTSTNHHVDLAEARMAHQVSGWVTMVERSNGETCRSVKHPDEGRYTSLPVVELRLLIQNTGLSSSPIVIRRDQIMTVDASTRRRGEEWKEITWDNRFEKQWMNVHDQPLVTNKKGNADKGSEDDLVELRLYESVILLVHIHCKGCSTSSKFQQRANFTKVLVQINGTTVPLVIPFFREH